MKHIFSFLFILFLYSSAYAQLDSSKSIDSLYRITVNEVEHAVFVKGQDLENPILFVIHGGPGFSDFYFWQTYNKALEKHFTVVTYDQRGTGLSFHESIPKTSMNFEQLTDDAHALMSTIKNELGQDRLYVVGFSAGTIVGVYLATLYPEEIEAFISVGQVVNGRENEKLCLEYNLQKSKEQNNLNALDELKPLMSFYPSGEFETDFPALKKLRSWNRKNNGDFCKGTSMNQLFAGIDPEPKQYLNQELIGKGESFSMSLLWKEIIDLDLLSTHEVFKVPVYFLVGKCDFNTPYALTEKYFDKVKAPHKEIVYFDNSGHYIPFVEPEKFNSLLISVLN